jgi:DNA repair protein RecN (Recombination protein N)
MLRFLGVRRLAVIDRLDIELEPGLNILTGETGAGKTILVQALDLLIGGRASGEFVRTGEESASIQAIFERADGGEVIVRREISAQGRSRAFIDDALATSAALRELGRELVDLHGQHEHQTLLDPAEHRAHLDAFVNNPALVESVGAAFQAWQATAAALDRSRLDDREKDARIEMVSFQLQEIQKIAPGEDEDERLLSERTVLRNADKLTRLSTEAYGALYEGESSALEALAVVWKRVAELAELDPRLLPYLEGRDAVKATLEDLSLFLRSYAADLDASPEQLQTVEDRLALLERLKRKYGPTLADVHERLGRLREELSALGASEERAAALAAAEQSTRETFLKEATRLSRARAEAGPLLARGLEKALAELAMPKSRVVVDLRPRERSDQWTRHGADDVELFLSSNPGEDPRPLARIASGGELSRVLLALRTLVDVGDAPRTLVFDEVDAGIGGAAADAVGARLQALAARHQVLCITHLPQIAARQGAHFQISKDVRAGRTLTLANKLDATGRELEVARMIAGAQVSAQVLSSAREMLETRAASEAKAKAKAVSFEQAKAKGRSRGR